MATSIYDVMNRSSKQKQRIRLVTIPLVKSTRRYEMGHNHQFWGLLRMEEISQRNHRE